MSTSDLESIVKNEEEWRGVDGKTAQGLETAAELQRRASEAQAQHGRGDAEPMQMLGISYAKDADEAAGAARAAARR